MEEGGTAKYTLEKPVAETREPGAPFIFHWWATKKYGAGEKADLTNITSNMEVYAYYGMYGRITFSKATVTTTDGEVIDLNYGNENLIFPDYTSYAQKPFEDALETNQSQGLTEFFNSNENIDSFNILYCIAFKIDNFSLLQANATFIYGTIPDKKFKAFQCMDVENDENRWVELSDDKCVNDNRNAYC